MNTSFDPLHLVNTYGAFGSVTRERLEVVIEGSASPIRLTQGEQATQNAEWKEYEFKGKPGDVRRRPPQIAPYHLRLDWLMWFLPFRLRSYHPPIVAGHEPWFVHFLAKLLQGDRAVLKLLRSNPFPDHPPENVRAQLYHYEFTTPEERRRTGAFWKRELLGTYFPPVSLSDPAFAEVLRAQGWPQQ